MGVVSSTIFNRTSSLSTATKSNIDAKEHTFTTRKRTIDDVDSTSPSSPNYSSSSTNTVVTEEYDGDTSSSSRYHRVKQQPPSPRTVKLWGLIKGFSLADLESLKHKESHQAFMQGGVMAADTTNTNNNKQQPSAVTIVKKRVVFKIEDNRKIWLQMAQATKKTDLLSEFFEWLQVSTRKAIPLKFIPLIETVVSFLRVAQKGAIILDKRKVSDICTSKFMDEATRITLQAATQTILDEFCDDLFKTFPDNDEERLYLMTEGKDEISEAYAADLKAMGAMRFWSRRAKKQIGPPVVVFGEKDQDKFFSEVQVKWGFEEPHLYFDYIGGFALPQLFYEYY
jgi:hypothetical protein